MKKTILILMASCIIAMIGFAIANITPSADPSPPNITSAFTEEEKEILEGKFGTSEYVITSDYISDTEYCFTFSPVNKKRCIYNYQKEMEIWTSRFDVPSNTTIISNPYNLSFEQLREREIIDILRSYTVSKNITIMDSAGYTQGWDDESPSPGGGDDG